MEKIAIVLSMMSLGAVGVLATAEKPDNSPDEDLKSQVAMLERRVAELTRRTGKVESREQVIAPSAAGAEPAVVDAMPPELIERIEKMVDDKVTATVDEKVKSLPVSGRSSREAGWSRMAEATDEEKAERTRKFNEKMAGRALRGIELDDTLKGQIQEHLNKYYSARRAAYMPQDNGDRLSREDRTAAIKKAREDLDSEVKILLSEEQLKALSSNLDRKGRSRR